MRARRTWPARDVVGCARLAAGERGADGDERRSAGLTPTVSRRAAEPSNSGAAVGAALQRLDQVLRVRHHAEDVAALVEDAGDGVERAVGVGGVGGAAVGVDVAEGDAVLALEPGERRVVAAVVAVAMGDRARITWPLA